MGVREARLVEAMHPLGPPRVGAPLVPTLHILPHLRRMQRIPQRCAALVDHEEVLEAYRGQHSAGSLQGGV